MRGRNTGSHVFRLDIEIMAHAIASTATRNAIKARRTFTTYGAMVGVAGRNYSTGYLRGEAQDAYYADANEIDFTVYSYATPIAWHTPTGWTYVDQRFSTSTSKHQSAVRGALYGESYRVVNRRYYLSDAQRSLLLSAVDAIKSEPFYLTIKGQQKRSAVALAQNGLIQISEGEQGTAQIMANDAALAWAKN